MTHPETQALDALWEMALTPAGRHAGPGDLDAVTGWIPAPVPGTAAGALRTAGRWSEAEPTPLHAHDIWYRTRFIAEGRERLRFEGLATLAEVWLNGVPVLDSRSMFLAHDIEADLSGENALAIVFRSLTAELDRPHKRGRWRPRLVTPGSLRHQRTSLLGFMPGWCPAVEAVGPYRPVTRTPLTPRGPRVTQGRLDATLDGTHGETQDGTLGHLVACLRIEGAAGPVRLRCDGRETGLTETAPGRFEGVLALPGIAPWWPHSHGEPRLHAVEAVIDGQVLPLGRTGFRTLALTRPFAEGLGLSVNGVPVFCRGAVWMPADLVGLPGEPESYRARLMLAREAGVNMLRVSGITLYEADAFHALCDELGILVFQDLMLANFDYPTEDPGFRDLLVREIEQCLARTRLSPSLAIVGGGSEVFQQAAMLGYPRAVWEGDFVTRTLPALVAAARPDLIVVPNSPSGGDLPFSVRAGVTHYYGVGAYCRPLDDARHAEVGFATECLAFANVPEPATLRETGLSDPDDPRWAAGVPRDRGADWDFETVRDHYVARLFRADPAALRREDPERYLQLGRAAVAETIEATFAAWRRVGARTAGGLVFTFSDLGPGAGWGVIDDRGRPKSAWYALKRAFRPVQVLLTDEGLDGLHAHVLNETAASRALTLRLTFTDAAGKRVAGAERAVAAGPRSAQVFSSSDLLGRFFDATDAYRFGPPAHSLGHACLLEADSGAVLAEAFHFPQGREAAPGPVGLSAELVERDGHFALRVACARHALGVAVEMAGAARAEDSWFHLAPGAARILALTGAGARPRGIVRALNASEVVRFGYDD